MILPGQKRKDKEQEEDFIVTATGSVISLPKFDESLDQPMPPSQRGGVENVNDGSVEYFQDENIGNAQTPAEENAYLSKQKVDYSKRKTLDGNIQNKLRPVYRRNFVRGEEPIDPMDPIMDPEVDYSKEQPVVNKNFSGELRPDEGDPMLGLTSKQPDSKATIPASSDDVYNKKVKEAPKQTAKPSLQNKVSRQSAPMSEDEQDSYLAGVDTSVDESGKSLFNVNDKAYKVSQNINDGTMENATVVTLATANQLQEASGGLLSESASYELTSPLMWGAKNAITNQAAAKANLFLEMAEDHMMDYKTSVPGDDMYPQLGPMEEDRHWAWKILGGAGRGVLEGLRTFIGPVLNPIEDAILYYGFGKEDPRNPFTQMRAANARNKLIAERKRAGEDFAFAHQMGTTFISLMNAQTQNLNMSLAMQAKLNEETTGAILYKLDTEQPLTEAERLTFTKINQTTPEIFWAGVKNDASYKKWITKGARYNTEAIQHKTAMAEYYFQMGNISKEDFDMVVNMSTQLARADSPEAAQFWARQIQGRMGPTAAALSTSDIAKVGMSVSNHKELAFEKLTTLGREVIDVLGKARKQAWTDVLNSEGGSNNILAGLGGDGSIEDKIQEAALKNKPLYQKFQQRYAELVSNPQSEFGLTLGGYNSRLAVTLQDAYGKNLTAEELFFGDNMRLRTGTEIDGLLADALYLGAESFGNNKEFNYGQLSAPQVNDIKSQLDVFAQQLGGTPVAKDAVTEAMNKVMDQPMSVPQRWSLGSSPNRPTGISGRVSRVKPKEIQLTWQQFFNQNKSAPPELLQEFFNQIKQLLNAKGGVTNVSAN